MAGSNGGRFDLMAVAEFAEGALPERRAQTARRTPEKPLWRWFLHQEKCGGEGCGRNGMNDGERL